MIDGTPARFEILISMMRDSRPRVPYSSRCSAAPTPSGTAMSVVMPIT